MLKIVVQLYEFRSLNANLSKTQQRLRVFSLDHLLERSYSNLYLEGV